MEKQQIISFIQSQMAAGKISAQDLMAVAGGQTQIPQPSQQVSQGGASKEGTSSNLINTLYVIGALIVLVGVVILTYQHWDEIGFLGRVGVTLGISLVAFIVALLIRAKLMLSQVFFTMSAFLAPLGAAVVLNQLSIPFDGIHQGVVAVILFVIFALGQCVVWNNVLVVLLTGFATWAYYAFLGHLFSLYFYDLTWAKWASIFLGISYLFIGYGYRSAKEKKAAFNQEERGVSNVLYGLGTLAILGAGISLGGAWDFAFVLVVFAAFYGSIYLQSRAMLLFAALFLIADIFKITSQYFLNSLSWPVVLIVCGFLVIAVGYGTFALNKKYFPKQVVG